MHGVEAGVIENARDAMERFFALPENDKRAVQQREHNLRGYIPTMLFGTNTPEAPPTTYEGFNLGVDAPFDDLEVATSGGLYGPNLWPDAPEEFRDAITVYWDGVDAVYQRLLGAFALTLGQEEDRLTAMFTKQLTNISLLHYHARPETIDAPQGDALAHRDTNAITLLLSSQVGGLQVQGNDGTYREVTPESGCFVVNMMECWSGGRFHSTMYRVHPPRHLEHFSIGFFAVPDHNTVVEPLPGLPVNGKPEDLAPRHTSEDLEGFVDHFDQQGREMSAV